MKKVYILILATALLLIPSLFFAVSYKSKPIDNYQASSDFEEPAGEGYETDQPDNPIPQQPKQYSIPDNKPIPPQLVDEPLVPVETVYFESLALLASCPSDKINSAKSIDEAHAAILEWHSDCFDLRSTVFDVCLNACSSDFDDCLDDCTSSAKESLDACNSTYDSRSDALKQQIQALGCIFE